MLTTPFLDTADELRRALTRAACAPRAATADDAEFVLLCAEKVAEASRKLVAAMVDEVARYTGRDTFVTDWQAGEQDALDDLTAAHWRAVWMAQAEALPPAREAAEHEADIRREQAA